MDLLASLTILLPGIGALLAAILGYGLSKRTDEIAMGVTSGLVCLAAVFAWVVFGTMAWGGQGTISAQWLTWMQVSGFSVALGAHVDMLAATMMMVVTTISACVHVYSVGYMDDDPDKRRFFIYLSLFTLAMLVLVSADNLLQMFLGWEGVGVMSYLLIGFWHHKESANAAAMKAFIVNRVSDTALLVGMFMLLAKAGSLAYVDIFAKVPEMAVGGGLFWPALLIFVGAMGKSAQFGLHVWLPDAMEGPTPVSALIHAATMVTAGVFLLCRLSPLYEHVPAVLQIVGWVGATTAIFAATVGLTQTDMKRVIAYSTCSQLGYMFFAVGVGAYPAAMFHLTTHAFFKALLFLGAGSVIHSLHHEQNIFNMARKLGDLRKILPITYGLMWVGSLALAGIPPFAGFFSKDAILEHAAMAPGGLSLYVAGTLGALLTAIYSFRVLFVAFHGEPAKKANKVHGHHAPHESGWWILAPMMPLALGAVAAGLGLMGMLEPGWWKGALTVAVHPKEHLNLVLKFLPLLVALSGIGIAYALFLRWPQQPAIWAKRLAPLHAFSLNKWYVDEAYDAAIVQPLRTVSAFLANVVDKRGIDGFVNVMAESVRDTGMWVRRAQTGELTHYAFVMLLAVVVALGFVLWRGM
jgi:NADH-quinone oxidoreductase subunit L